LVISNVIPPDIAVCPSNQRYDDVIKSAIGYRSPNIRNVLLSFKERAVRLLYSLHFKINTNTLSKLKDLVKIFIFSVFKQRRVMQESHWLFAQRRVIMMNCIHHVCIKVSMWWWKLIHRLHKSECDDDELHSPFTLESLESDDGGQW